MRDRRTPHRLRGADFLSAVLTGADCSGAVAADAAVYHAAAPVHGCALRCGSRPDAGARYAVRRERTVPVRTDVQPSAGDTGTRTGKPPDSSKIEAGALTFEAVVFEPTALLHAARRIVETASRGTHKLTLESREGLGSTFRFAMDFALAEPVLEPECERLPEMDEEKTVLLVDDSEINLVMECELLRSFGLQVDTAASAGDALRLAEQRVYDLVLLDIRMPDMDGYELAKRLRRLETYRAVPLLALTADAVGGVRERALDDGMNDCITMPVRPDRLYQVLRRYFALAVDAPETLATDHGDLFRRERALATLGGDREKLAALCRRFLRAHSRSAEYVRLHLEHGRPANARALLHDLIGLAGNLGCDALSGASRVLLDEVHHGRIDTLPQFTEVFDRTIEELRSFAETQTEPLGKPMEQAARKLKKLVENYDFSAVQWFEQHGRSLRHTMPPELFARLSEALERYDFERAAKLLDEKEE